MPIEGLCALWLIASGVYVGHSLAASALPGGRTAERWALAAILGVCSAIGAFQLLAAFGAFRLPQALAGSGLAALGAYGITRRSPRAVLTQLGADLQVAVDFALGHGGWPQRVLRALLLAFGLIVFWRALVLPPVAWDAVMYHAGKAALWVQSGGSIDFDLPGAWSVHRHYPPGGEILGAWAMLPFHDDTLYLWVDVAALAMWAPLLVCLMREAGVDARLQPAACLYLLTVPGVYYFIPGGYVEVSLYLLLYGGLWLCARAMRGVDVRRSATFAGLSLATAVTIKITALPLLALGCVAICAAHLRKRPLLAQAFVGLVAGGLLSLPTLGALLLSNVAELGYPLSPYPVKVMGLTLGEALPIVEITGEVLAASADPARAMGETLVVFGLGSHQAATLGPLAPLWLLAMPFAAVSLARRRPAVVALLAAVAVAQLLFFFSEGFRPVRITHGYTNGRFLHPLITAATVLTLATVTRGSIQRVVNGAMLLAACLACATQLGAAGGFEQLPIALGSLSLVLLVCAASAVRSDAGARALGRAVLAVAVVGLVVGTPALRSFRDSVRYRAPAESRVADALYTYWVELARRVDDPDTPRRLAITQGHDPFYATGLFYYFLGRRLQNELRYVSSTRDGSTPVYDVRKPADPRTVDGQAWLERVARSGVDHVVMLRPPHFEQLWMQQHPDRFERIAGNRERYGLYRVLEPTSGE